ncbi:hypothetical protein DB30_06845 [Enhygromyxa salina]|uniref:Uncharacterized protein n=1 Tax=Enhygromyxa salina TaxID=215803 RepID=A0A0C2CXK1_9BACT|nr:hypothetical protein DB30_06845 [Enhygromyxa salina]
MLELRVRPRLVGCLVAQLQTRTNRHRELPVATVGDQPGARREANPTDLQVVCWRRFAHGHRRPAGQSIADRRNLRRAPHWRRLDDRRRIDRIILVLPDHRRGGDEVDRNDRRRFWRRRSETNDDEQQRQRRLHFGSLLAGFERRGCYNHVPPGCLHEPWEP